MFAYEVRSMFVHRGDQDILEAVYKNEETLGVLIKRNDDYIEELENQIGLLKDALYELQTVGKGFDRTISDAPYQFRDILKPIKNNLKKET